METTIKKLSLKYYLIIVLISILPSFISLIRPGFFPIQDDLQTFRIQQMDTCLKNGQIPCRWIPDGGYGYGYPLFNYYPPSVYYFGDLFHLIGFQFIDVVKILFILGYIAGALAMFLLVSELMGSFPGLISALLYTYAPYKAVNVYVRGDINEFWAGAFFPLILWSIIKVIRSPKLIHSLWLALSVAGLLLTHNLMAMIFLPIAMVWTIIWLILEKAWVSLPKLILGVAWGIGLAAFFTLPVLFEGKYVHLESLVGGYFGYEQHFVDLYQLFISNFWGYGSSILGPNDGLSLSTGQIHWLLGLLTLFLSILLFKRDKKLGIIFLSLGAIEIVILFLMHQRSIFIWHHLPFLVWLQFPWRFLADSIFLLSFLVGGGIYLLRESGLVKLSYLVSGVAIVGVLLLHLSFFQPKAWLNISDHQKFSGAMLEHQLTASIFDYLPIYATLPPTGPAPQLPEVLNGQASVIHYFKGTNYQIGQVDVSQNATIRLPLYDFPGMMVLDNGQLIGHRHTDCQGQKDCLGLISFDLAAGSHQIKAYLADTIVRTIGNWLTLISLVAMIGFLTYPIWRRYAKIKKLA